MKNSEHTKISLRVDGKVTSITLKKNIIALWLIFGTDIDIVNTELDVLSYEVNDFIYSCLDKWENNTAKGLSAYITNRMVKAFLNKKKYKSYLRVIRGIK